MEALKWDLFCRVIDNHGDVGVCWRLAVDLALRGQQVRLWIDDASALSWMAPEGAAGVVVLPWPSSDDEESTPGDVVIEAFGCELPPFVVARMASVARHPVWIDLEYLSAEDYVLRSHGLASPQASGPGAGLPKRFFYPGFTAPTGGLIREPLLMSRRQAFDPAAWLHRHGIERRPNERIVSLFCYEQPALPALLSTLAESPTLLLSTHGHATRQAAPWLGTSLCDSPLRVLALPSLTQTDYDHLLWSCDLNFVRGEDSFVRAQWAGAPFVWQAYPQQGGAHLAKIDAFLRLHLAGANAETAAHVRRLWAVWNGIGPANSLALPASEGWRRVSVDWRDRLLAESDLTSRLLAFVAQACRGNS